MNLERDMINIFKDYILNYYYGEIIGEADLVDCILIDEGFNEKLNNINSIVYGRTNHIGLYAWKLENVVKYDKNIKIKG